MTNAASFLMAMLKLRRAHAAFPFATHAGSRFGPMPLSRRHV